MPPIVKIAAVQFDPKITRNKENLERMLVEIKTAAANGAKLIVFSECALCGYVYSSREEALPFMETIPGPSVEKLAAACKALGVYAVMGLLEKDGNNCYNTAVLTGPEGLIGKYRKVHLPFLGIDRFVDHGDTGLAVYKTPIGNIGLFICYDVRFPESARVMALAGADILILPTNWPEGVDKVARYVIVTRALENHVHLVACDRVGNERGATFIGTSKIIDYNGDTVAQASTDQEETIYGEVDISAARQKKIITRPGESEIDLFADRHPEYYGEITKPNR
jgi:predicted amidohydrolase